MICLVALEQCSSLLLVQLRYPGPLLASLMSHAMAVQCLSLGPCVPVPSDGGFPFLVYETQQLRSMQIISVSLLVGGARPLTNRALAIARRAARNFAL
jgi:hypothetical protein